MMKCDIVRQFDGYGLVVPGLEQDYERMEGLEIIA